MIIIYFIIHYVTLYFLSIKYKNWKNTFLIHFAIQFSYSLFILFGIYYISEGGTALGWTLSYMLILFLHWLINLITLLIMTFNQNKKESQSFKETE